MAREGVGEVYQTAFYGLPSDVAVVGVWREGMLYLTNTLSGVGAVYQTAFYGLAMWRCRDQEGRNLSRPHLIV